MSPGSPGDFLTPTFAVIELPYISHNETLTNQRCPPGTTEGGLIDIHCFNNTPHVTNGRCKTNCPEGSHDSNGVILRYPMIAHERSPFKATCAFGDPNFVGIVTLRCSYGKVVYSGECLRRCEASTISSRGAVVPHPLLLPNNKTTLACALGNAGVFWDGNGLAYPHRTGFRGISPCTVHGSHCV